MSYIKKFLFHTCAYTTGLTLVFYLFAIIFSLPEQTIGIERFLLLLAFSSVIALSEFIFEIKNLKPLIKYLIHYLALFISFFVLFLTVRFENGSTLSVPYVFACWFIFSIFYGAAVLLVIAIKKNSAKKVRKEN